jgi:branched-chain amino acid transport system ATP-binding protein
VYAAIRALRGAGMTLLLVEQNIQLALATADHVYVLDTGRVALEGSGAELRAQPSIERSYFGATA